MKHFSNSSHDEFETPALAALFALSKRIQKERKCGEIEGFIRAKHARPDLYELHRSVERVTEVTEDDTNAA